jgi:hypothetical protein
VSLISSLSFIENRNGDAARIDKMGWYEVGYPSCPNGFPYDDEAWHYRQAKRFGLERTLCREGRPRTAKAIN